MASILIGGGTGLIGMRLSRLLADAGHRVRHLSRTPDPSAEFPAYAWDIQRGTIDEAAVHEADAVINLAGAGIADRRWTDQRKALITASRTQTTRLLGEAMARVASPPRCFVSAGAVGYYGDRGDSLLTEDAKPGEGFLSESCLAWEHAVHAVAETGIRTAILRAGIVLSTRGGALARMMPPVRFALAPYFGSGRQWYSWIHIDDLCRQYMHVLDQDDLGGTFNAVAPQPVRNRELMEVLPRAMDVPAIQLSVPAFGLRLVFGEMAHTILDSVRASSAKMEATGFTFQYAQLEDALEDLIRTGK